MATAPENVHQLSAVAQMFDADALKGIRDRIRAIIDTADGYNQSVVAREVGMSVSTLSFFLSGTYTGNNQRIASKLVDWLNTYDEQEQFDGLPAAPAWAATPTSNRVLTALRYARMTGGIVLVVGVAGVGKSKSIEQYAAISPNVWHVELSAGTGSIRGALEEICTAVGIRNAPHNVPGMQRAIAAKLKDTKGVLVIDEAQHASVRTLDQIRWFNDKLGIGIVFSGNEMVQTQFSPGTDRARHLDRLYSRICKRVVINKVVPGDITAILEAWEVDNQECAEIAAMIARHPGALRTLTLALRLAATHGTAKGSTTITPKALRAAAHELEVTGLTK